MKMIGKPAMVMVDDEGKMISIIVMDWKGHNVALKAIDDVKWFSDEFWYENEAETKELGEKWVKNHLRNGKD